MQGIRKHAQIFSWLWFTLLACLFTWPLITHAMDQIAGEIGDNIYFVWMIGWVQKALFTLKTNPLDVSFLNYPAGWNLASTEMTPAQLLIALPFSLLKGETFGYNMAMLMSFILSGVLMSDWVRHMSGSNFAGFIAGTIFACLPYRQAHFLIGHLNLSGTQWIPLFFWGWFDLMKPGVGEFRKKPALFAALGLGLTALTSQYYFYMLVFVAFFQAAFVFLFRQRNRFKDIATWKTLGLFLLLAFPFVLSAELPFLSLAGSGGMPDRNWGSARAYSAGLSDYLLPGTTHFLFGDWVGTHFNRDIWIEGTLYIGFLALILFLIGFIRRTNAEKSVWNLVLVGAITAVILSMGTDLHWNETPVELYLPDFLRETLGRDSVPILLPGFFFFKVVPFYAKQRAMMRFGIFALTLIAVGAGYGAKWVAEHVRGKPRALILLLIPLLLLFDYFPAPIQKFSIVSSRPVDKWLAEQPGNGSVMRYPFYLNDDQEGTYYTLYNEKPFIGGFFNAFPPEQYREIADVMKGFPSEASIKKASSLKVKYYLIETTELERAIAAKNPEVPWNSLSELLSACEDSGLGLVGTFDDVLLYMMNDEEDCDCEWIKETRPN